MIVGVMGVSGLIVNNKIEQMNGGVEIQISMCQAAIDYPHI